MTSTDTIPVQGFQAEVRQLLEIVIHSLYTDREIFVRELVSNASDALEKLRVLQLTEKDVYQADKGLEISITTDAEAKTLTISDTGIGMTREELVAHLGTIAHSGTKSFLKQLKEKGDAGQGMIGQFGVGFYSAFMVADHVDVISRSWHEKGESLVWSSDGKEGYSISPTEDAPRGCQVVIHLRDEHEEYAKPERIRAILRKYSNFVAFPILLNGERVNTVDALWLKPKNEVTEEETKEFYKFIAHAWDEPAYTMHFSADAPLEIHSLLFVPGENNERFGMGQMEPGVALHCRRVMIDPKPEGLLPPWLRFLKGVVDSSDLPLNISRESMQDSALVRKISQVITKRFLKFLEKQAQDDAEKFRGFFEKFGRFLKEGIATSYEYQQTIAPLLRFESSMTEEGKVTSFGDYLTRAKDGQDKIYYIVAPNRSVIENGPYLEAFKARGIEVAYFTDSVDEYVLETLGEYEGKKLIPADRADLDLGDVAAEGDALGEDVVKSLCDWMLPVTGESIRQVITGKRLVDSPAIALVPENAPNGHMRAMLRAMGQEVPDVEATLEINPRHPLVKRLAQLRDERPELAEEVTRQIADQALLAAGLVEHPQEVAQRMNKLLEKVL